MLYFPLHRSVGNRLLYPLVFIVSESHRSGASSSSLFTKTAINNMDIHNIRYKIWNAMFYENVNIV